MPIPDPNKARELLETRQREDANKRDGFATWLEKPEVRIVLELIPEEWHRFALPLMNSAFQAGHSAGGTFAVGEVAAMFASAVTKPNDKD